jgi:hypothetical protein
METSKLIPAPIDNKNIMEDWIEEIFDEQSALCSKHEYIGFIGGLGFTCRIEGNNLRWLLIHGGYFANETERHNALDTLYKRLKEIDKDNEESGIRTEYYRIGLIGLSQSFYFVDED